MRVYRRRLSHADDSGAPVFLTWRLHGSLPPNRASGENATSSVRTFAAMDRALDEARTGPTYLRQPTLANMVLDSLHFNASILGHFDLHAFVVMPNHIHLLVTPNVELPRLTQSLKGITSKRANAILMLSGTPFWQEEPAEGCLVRKSNFVKIKSYIEQNPVRAGLVRQPRDFPWSSAAWEDTDCSVSGLGSSEAFCEAVT